MTLSEYLIGFLVLAALSVGFMVAQAYPIQDTPVPKSLAWVLLALLATLTLMVMHARRGRP